MRSTRPQTIGYALVDSPAALCAWIIEKFWAWTDCDGDLESVLTRDELLDNLMLYWLPRTGASSARLYWESIRKINEWISGRTTDTVAVPTGCSIFPKELQRPSRRWAEKRFLDIRYWNELDRGGHFAAFEQPKLFVDEVRSFGWYASRSNRPWCEALLGHFTLKNADLGLATNSKPPEDCSQETPKVKRIPSTPGSMRWTCVISIL